MFSKVLGVANGLQYLHSKDVIHGDIKCVRATFLRASLYWDIISQENVLINDEGLPCLCDIGLSKIVDHRGYTTAFTETLRFLAPELLPIEDDTPVGVFTKATDVYGLSMLMLQVSRNFAAYYALSQISSSQLITGKLPYFYVKSEFKILSLLVKGNRPDRARYTNPPVEDEVWQIMEGAWAHSVQSRLSIDQVVSRLDQIVAKTSSSGRKFASFLRLI